MPSKRETILTALHLRLESLAAPVLRGDVLPERIPATGLIILRDGKPGEPDVTLSPVTYFYEHRAELEVVIQAGAGRDALFDALANALADATRVGGVFQTSISFLGDHIGEIASIAGAFATFFAGRFIIALSAAALGVSGFSLSLTVLKGALI
ncbi:MAG: hypothetical protein WCS20_16705, partial [Alphaproteobacteria bacterium]